MSSTKPKVEFYEYPNYRDVRLYTGFDIDEFKPLDKVYVKGYQTFKSTVSKDDPFMAPIPNYGTCTVILDEDKKQVYERSRYTVASFKLDSVAPPGMNLVQIRAPPNDTIDTLPEQQVIQVGKKGDDVIFQIKCNRISKFNWSSVHINSKNKDAYVYQPSSVFMHKKVIVI